MAASVVPGPAEILLVEDNPGDARLAHEALARSGVGARLHVARDGVEAMQFLRGHPPFAGAPRPDLVFLDLNLPRKDGRAVLAEIKGDPDLRRLPVVVLSSTRAEEDVALVYDLQAACFVHKPADWEAFSGVFSAAVGFWVAGGGILRDAAAGPTPTRVLLIAADAEETRLVRQVLDAVPRDAFSVIVAPTLREGVRRLAASRYEAVLLDTALPDAEGAASFERLLECAPGTAILTLLPRVAGGDRPVTGAAPLPDILAPESLDPLALAGALRRGIERQRWRRALGGAPQPDALTGLPTRGILIDRLGLAIEQARRRQRAVALIRLDLDPALAAAPEAPAAVGDEAVRLAAGRLRARLRGSDTLARTGACEFGIVVDGLGSARDLRRIARKLLEAAGAPAGEGGPAARVLASIGASLFPADGGDPEALLRRAEAALRRARAIGAGGFASWSPLETAFAPDRSAIAGRLAEALRRDELLLHYQPILDSGGRCAGAEALLRWRHPEWGLLYPRQFLAEAETAGLIHAVGDWVLGAACGQARSWQAAGRRGLRVAVNLSPLQLAERDRLLETLRGALQSSGLEPGLLELQVDGGTALRDPAAVLPAAREVHALGVRISVDNFAAGAPALERLRNLPFDAVRIDRSRVSGVTRDPGDAAVVNGIIVAAHARDLLAVAEGVESIGQLDFLLEHRIDQVQGHYIGRPAAPEQCAALFASAAAGAG
jgi:diguanylate cyclase (GGDEF)-like protein